jgi:hypothetical protein
MKSNDFKIKITLNDFLKIEKFNIKKDKKFKCRSKKTSKTTNKDKINEGMRISKGRNILLKRNHLQKKKKF